MPKDEKGHDACYRTGEMRDGHDRDIDTDGDRTLNEKGTTGAQLEGDLAGEERQGSGGGPECSRTPVDSRLPMHQEYREHEERRVDSGKPAIGLEKRLEEPQG